MRTTANTATVRLYHLDETDPLAHTLFYGTLNEALAIAAQHPENIQANLWLATENDVIAYRDLEGADFED